MSSVSTKRKDQREDEPRTKKTKAMDDGVEQEQEVISISSTSLPHDDDDDDDEDEAKFWIHDGEIELDEDSDWWADHDELCHGPRHTKANMRSFPNGFIWSCCDRYLGSKGCQPSEVPPPDDYIGDDSSVEDTSGHDGELEIVEDEWPDHDERCHGPIDTKENHRRFPHGFQWSCCGKDASSLACDDDDDDDEE